MVRENIADGIDKLAAVIEAELTRAYGPTLRGQSLASALGYSSSAALRQAARMGRVSVPLFTPQNRRGRWAMTREVARWLAEQRYLSPCDSEASKMEPETMS